MSVDTLGVNAKDDVTLEIRLEAPTPFFLKLIEHRGVPVPKWAIEEHVREWIHPQNIAVNSWYA